MKIFHEYWILSFGILLLGTIQDLCAETEKRIYRAPGESLDLLLPYSKDSVTIVTWKFNEYPFLEYTQGKNFTILKPKKFFSGRILLDSDKVTVQYLQEKDAGNFTVVTVGKYKNQPPTKKFTLYIQNPIRSAKIEVNQTLNCDIVLECHAPGEHVSYRWSGYKNSSESKLHFTVLPKDGEVVLNCTAFNNVNNQSDSWNYTCTAKSWHLEHFMLIAAGGGAAAALLFVFIIIALCCCRRSQRKEDASLTGTIDNTVYAEVTSENMAKNNATNGMSLYETVDELRHSLEKPETVYAKVSLPAHAKVSTATSSPYQQVL